MKKNYSLLLLLSVAILSNQYCFGAVTVLNLSSAQTVTDLITNSSTALTGATNVLIVVPDGYTGQAGLVADLTGLPASVKAVTLRGASSNTVMKTLQINVSGTNALDSLNMRRIQFNGVDDGTTIGSEYLFYPGAGTSVGVFSIDSCSARNYKGALRFANGTYRNIQINNSIFRSLGNYGFITYPLVNATTATITVSNSTFYSIDQSILYLKNATNTAVNISNCTFDNILNTTANFYYLNNTTGHSLSISSSIFGKTNSPTTASGVFGTPSPYTVTGCISATDWGTTAATAITGLTAYPGASTALFKSPSTFNSTTVTSSVVGDYTLLDNTVGSVGDPRWRKVITGLKTIKNNIFAYFADQNLIVNNVEVGSVISVYSFNGSLLNKQIANSNKVTVPVNSACIVKITSNKESVCLKMIK